MQKWDGVGESGCRDRHRWRISGPSLPGRGVGGGVGGEKTSRLRTMVELEPLGDVRSSMRGPARFSLGISSWPLERTLIIMP